MYRISLGIRMMSITPCLTNTLSFVDLVRDCLLLDRIGSRDYMQQSCTFCHRRESCSRPRGFYSEMTSMTVGRHGGSHYPMRASIPANAGMCGNSEFVLYIQCHQIHRLDTKGHQIRSTSRQPGTDTEKTRGKNTVNQSFELIHALLHLASP